MGLFGSSKSKTFLGVDIGGSSIKVVELLHEKGRAKLMTYGYLELPEHEGSDGLMDQPTTAGALLARLCKESGVKSTQAMTALQTSNVFSTILSLPKNTSDTKDQRAMKAHIDAEMGKVAPLPMSDMITYSTMIDGEKKDAQKSGEKESKPAPAPKQDTGYARVLVTGAAKTLVQKYIESFKEAKVGLQAIDTESFALIRSLIGKDRGAIMILDIGSKRTNVFIVEKGIPFVSRSINLGGDSVTRRMMEELKVAEPEAERAKRDLSNATNLTKLPPVLEAFMQPIVNEIRFALQLYANMELTELKRVEKIILTGGSSSLPYIPEYLSETLGMNVYRGDPWARVIYPKDVEGALQEIGPRMAIAVGLAMRDMDAS